MIYKVCGRKQHYCTSCDTDYYMSEDYCDKICFMKSDFYKREKGEFLNLLDRLDEGSRNLLIVFLENQHYLLNDHYVEWIKAYK